MVSCNKEDFYEKQFLVSPFENPATTGSVESGDQGGIDSGIDQGTQGGVNSGNDGGTNGSTTGSSTTGGTSGGVDGSTTGGTDGSVTTGGTNGATAGSTVGGVDGTSTSGSTTGSTGGGVDGSTTSGTSTGSSTGGFGDCNQGHGNDVNDIDPSNPTIGTDPKCKREKFLQSSSQTKKLDIVWIIDNSGSMSDEQTALGLNFSAFINEFIKKDVDFKMAITTTDVSSWDKKGKMVTGSDVKLTSAAARANETQFKTDFRTLVKVGTLGSGFEKGLEASEGFMQKYASTFVRSDAYLAVVVLSDEEDQSSKSVSHYTDYLKNFKSEAGLVKVYSIVDTGKTNSGTGITTGFQRYADASKNTAGKVSNIRDDFYKSLSAMGDSIINLLDSFALANNPVPGTLRVYVNGIETSDHTFDASSRSIKFNVNQVPPVGSEVTVYYVQQ